MSPPPHHQHHQQHKHQRQQSHSQLHQHYYALPPGAPPTRLGVSMGAPTSEDGSPSHHQSSSYDQRVAGAKHQSPACPTRLSVSLSEGSQSPEDILQPLARGGHQSPTGRYFEPTSLPERALPNSFSSICRPPVHQHLLTPMLHPCQFDSCQFAGGADEHAPVRTRTRATQVRARVGWTLLELASCN